MSLIEETKQLLIVTVIHRDSHEMSIGNKFWLGTFIAHIQFVRDVVTLKVQA
jgi:hypothetical protein